MAIAVSLRNRLRRKAYQIEVTLAVYMFTPWEKFAFWSIVFLLCSLTLIAAILYLPHHISILAGRAWYYINGEHVDVAASAREAVKEITEGMMLSGTESGEAAAAAVGAGEATATVVTEVAKETILKEL